MTKHKEKTLEALKKEYTLKQSQVDWFGNKYDQCLEMIGAWLEQTPPKKAAQAVLASVLGAMIDAIDAREQTAMWPPMRPSSALLAITFE